MRDAALVGTSELIGGTRPRDRCRASGLIAVVKAVVVPVAAPRRGHAAFIGAGECSRGAGAVCKKKQKRK